MGTEIERKFLVTNDTWRNHTAGHVRITQGYFTTIESCSIRVRISNDKANLNIKSATLGITRHEYDYPLPVNDAEEMLQNLCEKPLIEKTRHHVHQNGLTWEIDEFSGENKGLIVAEVELDSVTQPLTKPEWLGEEVSDDPRYYNVCLVKNPYKNW